MMILNFIQSFLQGANRSEKKFQILKIQEQKFRQFNYERCENLIRQKQWQFYVKIRRPFFELQQFEITMIYQVEESQLSCPQCSRKYINNSSCSSSQQSAEQYEQVIIPLKKHVVQHNQNIQQTLNILQEEVERLKTENSVKDKQISKLRLDMRDYLSKKMPQFPKIGKIYDSPQLAAQTENFLNSKKQHKSKQSKKKKKKKTEPSPSQSESSQNQEDQFSHRLQRKVKQLNRIKIDQVERIMEEVSYYQEQYMKIRQKLDVCLDEIEWMQKFCNSFVKMGQKISEIQGEKITKFSWPLRKKTKVTWKYVKGFIGQVIS